MIKRYLFSIYTLAISTGLHCDFLVKRTNQRLCALRYCSVLVSDMIKVYTCLVKSILEYSGVMFSNLLLYLSDAIKNVQKHCPPQIIFPTLSYTEADSELLTITLRQKDYGVRKVN